MQHLPLPVTTAEDKKVINKLANDDFWKPYQADWIAAYKNYQKNGGSPFAVLPHPFGLEAGKRQYGLYESRKNSGELARMRKKPGLKSCPMCGSPVTGSLDHYLPRNVYKEFSIMRANLVPACMHCNSSSKGTTVHGVDPRRFVHPYFDSWATEAIWFVELVAPYKAVRFRPRPIAGLSSPQIEIVEFHLENVLGTQFDLSMDNYWSLLPGQLKMRDAALTTASVMQQIDRELRVALHAGGTNCWLAALLRGIKIDPGAIEHLRKEALSFILPMVP